MPYDNQGQWYDEDEYGNVTYSDPYQYADYTQPGNGGATEHTYDPTTGQESNHFVWDNGDPWAPTPTGHPTTEAYFLPPAGTPSYNGDTRATPIPEPQNPGPNGNGNPGGGSWFTPPTGGGQPNPNFGAVPAPFGDTYTAAQRPDYLQGEYKPPVWDERYQALTADELASDPGYQNRLLETQRGLERSAAAKGKILSGGFIGRALPRELGALASQEYTAANDRKFNQYQQRYGAFLDAAGLSNQARTTNENAYQSDVGTGLNQYLARFNAYQTAIGNTRNAQGDLWSRNMDLARNSLTAAGLARP